MADFNEIFDEIKDEAVSLVKLMARKYREEAEKDVEDFLESSKEDIQRWTERLSSGELTTQEFEILISGLTTIAELKILKHSALAQQRIGQLIGGVLNIIIDVVLSRI